MKLFKGMLNSIVSITDGYQDGFFSVLGMGFFLQANKATTSVLSIADIIVTWGMAFIVGYGVIRITLNLIWNIFFGRDFHWKLGILEKLFQRLKPVQVQERIIHNEEEDHQAALKRMKVIMKKRQDGGGVKMGFKKFMSKLNANKWTILGVTSIAGVSALGAFGVINPTATVDLISNLGNLGAVENISGAVISTAAIVGTAGVSIKAVLGAGPESVEEYKERKEEVKAEKIKRKEAKVNGTNDIEKTAHKLMKIGIAKDEAYKMAKAGAAEKAKAHAAEVAKKEALAAAKAQAKQAKKFEKMGLSPEQIANLTKK